MKVRSPGLLIGPGCDRLLRLSDRDLEVAYLGDDSGLVEGASVSTDTKVIASARRVGVRTTENPDATELDVDETHYVRGTLDVVYTPLGRHRLDPRTTVRPCAYSSRSADIGSMRAARRAGR